MNKATRLNLSDVQELINNGKISLAKKTLPSIIKKQKLEVSDKIILANIYRQFLDINKALKVTGKEISLNEMKVVSDDLIALQATLAFILSHIGALYSAERIFNRIDQVCEDQNKNITEFFPCYYYYKTCLYLRTLDYKNSILYAEKSYQVLKNGSKYKKELISTMACIAESYFGLKEFHQCQKAWEKLLSYLDNDLSNYSQWIFHRLVNLNLEIDDLKQAEKILNTIIIQKKHEKNKIPALILICSFVYYTKTKDYKYASQLFNNDLEKDIIQKFEISEKQKLYYFAEKNPFLSLPLDIKIAIRAHLSFNYYCYILGRNYSNQKNIPFPNFNNLVYKENNHNCWLIGNGKINASNYEQNINNFRDSNHRILDLYSGVNFCENQVQSYLTPLQANALSAIIGAGSFGVNKWNLIEFLYQEDFFDPKAGDERLKNLIKTLKIIGFDIIRSKNYFSLEIDQNSAFVLPMNHTTRGASAYLKSIKQSFTRQDIENIFSIKLSTAKLWIKNWNESRIIKTSGTGKNIKYMFI